MERLSECEEMVMSVLWGEGGYPALAVIHEKVNERYGKTWKPQTVSTFLARLVRKRYLDYYQRGRRRHYVVIVTREEYCDGKFKGILDKMYEGNKTAMMEQMEGIVVAKS